MQLSRDGRYVVTLFDVNEEKDVQVVIDDRIPCWPCKAGQPPVPLSALNPETGSIWPLLLEKAFAKFCGLYSNLENNYGIWALATIAGCNGNDAQAYSKLEDQDVWTVLRPTSRPKAYSAAGSKARLALIGSMKYAADMPAQTTEQMLEIITSDLQPGKEAHSAGPRHLAVAIADGRPLTEPGYSRAYSVLKVQRVEVVPRDGSTSTVILILMHNPLGSETNWAGDWSDSSDLWSWNPEVAKNLAFVQGNSARTGEFWISHINFGQLFHHLHVLALTIDNELVGAPRATQALSPVMARPLAQAAEAAAEVDDLEQPGTPTQEQQRTVFKVDDLELSVEPVMAETPTQAVKDAAADKLEQGMPSTLASGESKSPFVDFLLETGTPDPDWEEDLPGAASAPPEAGGSAWTSSMYNGIASQLKALFCLGESFEHTITVFSYCPHKVVAEVAMVKKQAFLIETTTSASINVGVPATGGLSGNAHRKYEYEKYDSAKFTLCPPNVTTGKPTMQQMDLHEGCGTAYVTMYREDDPAHPFFEGVPVKAGKWACVYADST